MQKFHFLLVFEQRVYFIFNRTFYIQKTIFYTFFENFVICIFFFVFLSYYFCDTWPPIPISMSGKVLSLVSLSKILSTDQIVVFSKVQYFKKKWKYDVDFFTWIDINRSKNSIRFDMTGLKIPKVLQDDKPVITPEWL